MSSSRGSPCQIDLAVIDVRLLSVWKSRYRYRARVVIVMVLLDRSFKTRDQVESEGTLTAQKIPSRPPVANITAARALRGLVQLTHPDAVSRLSRIEADSSSTSAVPREYLGIRQVVAGHVGPPSVILVTIAYDISPLDDACAQYAASDGRHGGVGRHAVLQDAVRDPDPPRACDKQHHSTERYAHTLEGP